MQFFDSLGRTMFAPDCPFLPKYNPTLETRPYPYPILKTNAGEGTFYRMVRRCPLYKYKKTEAAGP